MCTSISARTCEELARKASAALGQGSDLVEFRIDLLQFADAAEIRRKLSQFAKRAIFTVRPTSEGGGFERDELSRLSLLRTISGLGPAFLDVELSTLENAEGLRSQLHCDLIVSWHSTSETPSREALVSVLRRASSLGIAKVVTAANTSTDNLTILSLYDEEGPPPIAFCMGPKGIFSRLMAICRGSPLTYASSREEATAPGQLPLSQVLAFRRRFSAD